MARTFGRQMALGVYAAMVVAAVAIVLVVHRFGEALVAPPPAVAASASAPAATAGAGALLHVLLALAAVVVVGRLVSLLLGAIGQPAVIGEMLAGILLGPSLLGRIAPAASAYLLPASAAPYLSVVAQIGVVFYMFLVGLDLNADLVRSRARATVAISHASIVAPFVLGSILALALYPRLATSDVRFTSFALFMGVAMSITAFPVLARILTDRGMSRTELGAVSLTCAAAGDVTAWCLLAFVVGVVQAEVRNALGVALLTLGFLAVMFLVVRPIVARLVARAGDRPPSQEALALALVGVLLSAVTTERIGVHAVFGAFLFGAVIRDDSGLARAIRARVEDVVVILLLPAFFAFNGMRTRIGLLSGTSEWLMCGLIVLVATVGKFGGSCLAARVTGMTWRRAAGLGALMNTRGLMELIVLGIGLDLGVISPTLFTMMVVMALATTMATTPLLQLLGIGPGDAADRAVHAAAR